MARNTRSRCVTTSNRDWLDVVTELELWQALRDRGITVIGSTSKRAALALADQVVVLVNGRVAARGTWRELEDRWGHLSG